MYKITIVKKAQDDLDWFRRNDKRVGWCQALTFDINFREIENKED